MVDQDSNSVIGGDSELRNSFGDPMELAVKKQLGKLDVHCKDFISRSPYLCIGTSAEDGKADVSPLVGIRRFLLHKITIVERQVAVHAGREAEIVGGHDCRQAGVAHDIH